MPDTPTPAPTLTDEQIMVARDDFRYAAPAGFPNADPYLVRRRFDAYIAAVIARAKQEERERIGDKLDAWAATIEPTSQYKEGRRDAAYLAGSLARREPDHA